MTKLTTKEVEKLTSEYQCFVQACEQDDFARQLETLSGIAIAIPLAFYDELINLYRCNWVDKAERVESLKNTAKDLICLIQKGLRVRPGRFEMEDFFKIDLASICSTSNDHRFKEALGNLGWCVRTKPRRHPSEGAQCRFVMEFLCLAFAKELKPIPETAESKATTIKDRFDGFRSDTESACKQLYDLAKEDAAEGEPTMIYFSRNNWTLHDSIEHFGAVTKLNKKREVEGSEVDKVTSWFSEIDCVLRFHWFDVGRPFNCKTFDVEPLGTVYENAAQFAHGKDRWYDRWLGGGHDQLMKGCRFLCYFALTCFECPICGKRESCNCYGGNSSDDE